MARAASRRPPRLEPSLQLVRDVGGLEPAEEWEGLELVGLDLSGWTADLVLTGCRLRAVRLVGADVAELRMTDCDLEDTDLSALTARQSSLVRVELRNCRMTGASLAGGTWRHV